MEFAIIAAGEGSRLRNEGFKFSKPMVVLNELTLIERLIQVFVNNRATKIHIIINEFSPELEVHLASIELGVPTNIIIKTTKSSLHSFSEILPFVTSNKICLTTVDTVFNEREFETFITTFLNDETNDGLMAATSFIDDESPLYIATNDQQEITGFYDDEQHDTKLISGGIYCLTSKAYPVINKAVENGVSRMRNFQRMLIEEGMIIKAYPFSKIIDIDHLTDINKAEDFLKEATIAD